MVTPELVEPIKPGQRPCSHPGTESTHPTNHELFLLGNVEVPTCNACEIARRRQLKWNGGHTPRSKPACDEATREVPETPRDNRHRAARVEGPQEEEQDTQADGDQQSNQPELLGPLGYDAGR